MISDVTELREINRLLDAIRAHYPLDLPANDDAYEPSLSWSYDVPAGVAAAHNEKTQAATA